MLQVEKTCCKLEEWFIYWITINQTPPAAPELILHLDNYDVSKMSGTRTRMQAIWQYRTSFSKSASASGEYLSPNLPHIALRNSVSPSSVQYATVSYGCSRSSFFKFWRLRVSLLQVSITFGLPPSSSKTLFLHSPPLVAPVATFFQL
jgi:hypothetical protein